MFKWGLKTSIALNLAFLLLFGMLMLDWVFITFVRQSLMDNETDRCEQVLATLKLHLTRNPLTDLNDAAVPDLEGLLVQYHVVAAAIRFPGQPPGAAAMELGNAPGLFDGLAVRAQQAQETGKRSITYETPRWGLLYKFHDRLIYSAPLTPAGAHPWGVALAVDLDPVNSRLAQLQQFFLLYILINAIVLTLFGLHRLGRLTVKPLSNLVRRAETYRDDGQGFLLPAAGHNEFNILSGSLNRLMARVDADREALNATVASLEAANRKLRQAQNDVIRAEKMASVGRLTAGIAHEIGNPIGIVLGYLELLRQEDLDPEERADCVARAETEIGRIDAIIRQLLDFARPAAGESTRLGVHGVLQEVAEVFQLQPLTADIPLALELAADRDSIKGDPAQLRQVFLNLMLNARDAIHAKDGGAGGALTIRTANETHAEHLDLRGNGVSERCLVIEVIDNGTGIESPQRENIFDPFFTTKAPGRGTGLGLAVSFTIITNLGGTIEALAEAPEGTRMRVCLPLASDLEPDPPLEPSKPQ